VKVHFQRPRQASERLVSEAEVHFEEGPLAGMRLLGFGVWKRDEGVMYVTFPSRVTAQGGARLYVDYLRSADGSSGVVRRLKAWILDEYRRQSGGRVDLGLGHASGRDVTPDSR
jgi:hypothetical protein